MTETFRAAWQQALYGPDGFYRRERPAAHFRTSVHASPLFGQAIARLARELDLDQVVDLGAGSGELGKVLRAGGLSVLDIELDDELPDRLSGLVIANEWLDNVPCEVVEWDDEGVPRYLLADLTPGPVVEGNDLHWLEQWWPPTTAAPGRPGDRAEIGSTRDQSWAAVVGRLARGSLAIAIDYGHLRSSRPPYGTLTGFRSGRECSPIPDGSCDITAHVALDSLGGTIVRQRDALRALGVSGARPSLDLAQTDPMRYLSELSSAGEAAELLDPSGLGGFGWVWTAADADTERRAARALSA
ncbi:SAM-dependent MidA family methyltransferase [Kribbella shirazensis]|uniref:SAM-dependent MidA family methyltransferase n=1 Tax=Kribbella shirazensis TaxID=1105143 RepID=A0A7X5V8E4_9ACTN|nr:SAM-dependent MidA family methyltransferase [Kribbella shirazensis]